MCSYRRLSYDYSSRDSSWVCFDVEISLLSSSIRSTRMLFVFVCSVAVSLTNRFRCSMEVITTSIWLFFSAILLLISCLKALTASDISCLLLCTSSVISWMFWLKVVRLRSTNGLMHFSASSRICSSYLDSLNSSYSFWLKQCQSP